MQEDLKKNFILLSKVAKEKKYAQEYLGLLARRGDLGSIRIGKRWYTSQEWFSEFLEDAEKRKEEAARSLLENSVAKISEPILESLPDFKQIGFSSGGLILETKQEAVPQQEFFAEEKKNVTVAGNTKEYASDYSLPETSPEIAERREISPEQISMRPMDFLPTDSQRIPLKRQEYLSRPIPSRFVSPEKRISRDIDLKARVRINNQTKPIGKIIPRIGDIAVSSRKQIKGRQEGNKRVMPIFHRVLEVKKSDNMFSPSFAEKESLSSLFFPKLAFGMAAVVLCLVLFQVAAFHKDDLMKKAGFKQNQGIVAGASDEKINSIKNVKSEADYYLSSSTDAMKESVSISKLMMRTALERNNNQ
jgi:hypothetical protein